MMAIYTIKPEMVEAEQWNKVGDASTLASVISSDVPGELKGIKCSGCGHPMENHGKMEISSGCKIFNSVCPSTYIVKCDGSVKLMSEKTFQERYELIK
jgi:hypothetical protein